MTENTLFINKIISIAALLIIAGILISIPFRLKKNGTESLKEKGAGFWTREIAIFVSSIVIVVLSFFIHFELVPTICLCGCGVLATWAGMQELFPKKED
jgi:L-asparagine transporter-like permease